MKRFVLSLIAVAILVVLATTAHACDHAAFTAGCQHCEARIVAAPVYRDSSRLSIEVAPGGYTQRYVERIQTPVMREYVATEEVTTTTTTTTRAPVREKIEQIEEPKVVYRIEQPAVVYRLTEPDVVFHSVSRQNIGSHCQQNLRQRSTFQLRQQQFNSHQLRLNFGSGARREEIREFKGPLGARRRVERREG